MACYHPIPAVQDEADGAVKLWAPVGTANLSVPCGGCVGCLTDRATAWANRAKHEAALWKANTFLTLTYDDEKLPADGFLRPRDLQLFFKRLRKYADSSSSILDRDRGGSIRYLACGEYGEEGDRPHYHLALFNCGFPDAKRVGKDLYESATVARLWTNGLHRLGPFTPAAAAYIAQYSLKKQKRRRHETWMDQRGFADADGVWCSAEPFLRSSRRPAIGAEWLAKYASDLQHGYLVSGSRRHAIPRYYRKKLEEKFPELHELVEMRLSQYRMMNPSDRGDPARLEAAETIHKRRKELTEARKL